MSPVGTLSQGPPVVFDRGVDQAGAGCGGAVHIGGRERYVRVCVCVSDVFDASEKDFGAKMMMMN